MAKDWAEHELDLFSEESDMCADGTLGAWSDALEDFMRDDDNKVQRRESCDQGRLSRKLRPSRSRTLDPFASEQIRKRMEGWATGTHL